MTLTSSFGSLTYVGRHGNQEGTISEVVQSLGKILEGKIFTFFRCESKGTGNPGFSDFTPRLGIEPMRKMPFILTSCRLKSKKECPAGVEMIRSCGAPEIALYLESGEILYIPGHDSMSPEKAIAFDVQKDRLLVKWIKGNEEVNYAVVVQQDVK